MRYLYYTQNVTYRIPVPGDAPDLPPKKLAQWLHDNMEWVFDQEKYVDNSDSYRFQIERTPAAPGRAAGAEGGNDECI